MINNWNNGISTSEDYKDLYFQIRFALEKYINPVDVLPSYCVLTRKAEPTWVETISMDNNGAQFEASLFKKESIKVVWEIIGEQSEWLIDLLNTFKENVNIPASSIERFLYYYTDMTAMFLRRR